MSANGHISRIAEIGVLRAAEKESVERSLTILRSRLDIHFQETLLPGRPLKRHFPFGSYTRGTLLPRSMDEHSDVDYMVVFSDSDAKPQAYLDRLKRFVEAKYPRSEIFQSNPTIVLSLNHINFELVPAIEGFFGGIKIPAKSSIYDDWMDTTPNDFNEALTQKNKNYANLIKPLARAVKYWNALNNYPYESFALERMVVDHTPLSIILFGGDLWGLFSSFIDELSTSWGDPDYKKRAIERAKMLVAEIKAHESRGEEYHAQQKLERLLPPIAT